MRRLWFFLILVCALVPATGAGAQTVDDLVVQLDLRGYATDEGVDVDVNELEDYVRGGSGDPVFLVVLGEPPGNGTDVLADELMARVEREGTVLVIVPFDDGTLEAGVASATLDNAALDAGIDAAFDQPSRQPVTFATVFRDNLGSSGGGGGGGGGLLILVVLLVVGGLVFWFVMSRRRRTSDAERLAAATAELTDDLGQVANDLLGLSERVQLADNSEAVEHYRDANDLYLTSDAALATVSTRDEIDELDDDLELAAWHLDAAEALLDGEPVPPKPDRRAPWERGGDRPAADSLPGGLPLPPPRPAPPRPAAPRPAAPAPGGGGNGMLGAILGGVLGSLGSGGRSRGGLRRVPRSTRRSSRRSSTRRPSSRRRSSRGRARRRG